MKKISGYFSSCLITGLLLLYVCIMSAVVPWTGDDISYLFNFADGSPIASIGDVITSQVAHWHCANGRFLAHFLVQTFLVLVGRTGFVAVNAFAYIFLILLLLELSGRKFADWKSTLAVCVLILVAMPTKFVPTCQIGYVWMFDIALFFLLEWKNKVCRKESSSKWNILWLAPLSLLAGASQEAIVIGIGVALALYSLKNIKNLGLYGWTMLLFFALGAASLCLSPANFGRTSEVHSSMGGLGDFAVRTIKFFLYQRVSYLMLALAIFLVKVRQQSISSVYGISPFLWNAWGALIVFNLAVGVFGNRQLFGAEVIAALLLLKLMSQFGLPERKWPEYLVAAALLCLLSVNTVSAFRSRTVYDEVVSQFALSEDGSVSVRMGYFDRHYRESAPADAWSWYVTGSVDRLLHLNGAPEEKKLSIK